MEGGGAVCNPPCFCGSRGNRDKIYETCIIYSAIQTLRLLALFIIVCVSYDVHITINYVWWKFQFSDTHFYSCKVSAFPLFINKWIKQLSLAVWSTKNEHISFFEIYTFLTMIFNQISWASYYMYICIYAKGVFLFWGSWISKWNPYSNLFAETAKISCWKRSAGLGCEDERLVTKMNRVERGRGGLGGRSIG